MDPSNFESKTDLGNPKNLRLPFGSRCFPDDARGEITFPRLEEPSEPHIRIVKLDVRVCDVVQQTAAEGA